MRKSGDFRAEYEGSVPFTCIFGHPNVADAGEMDRPSGDVVESLEDVNTGRLPQMGGRIVHRSVF